MSPANQLFSKQTNLTKIVIKLAVIFIENLLIPAIIQSSSSSDWRRSNPQIHTNLAEEINEQKSLIKQTHNQCEGTHGKTILI